MSRITILIMLTTNCFLLKRKEKVTQTKNREIEKKNGEKKIQDIMGEKKDLVYPIADNGTLVALLWWIKWQWQQEVLGIR